MSFDAIPTEWLPTAEAVKTYCDSKEITDFEILPAHVGTNTSPQLAEVYVKAATNNFINDDIKKSHTLPYLLTKFYTGKPQYALPADLKTYLEELGCDEKETHLMFLYLYSWKPERARAILSVIRSLIKTKEELYSTFHTDLDFYADVQKWLQEHGQVAPLSLVWVMRSSSPDQREAVFKAVKGNMNEMMRLLRIDADWEMIEDHFLERAVIPVSLFERLLEEEKKK